MLFSFPISSECKRGAASGWSKYKKDMKFLADQGQMLISVAKWIGICTAAANHFPVRADGESKNTYLRDSTGVATVRRRAKRKRAVSPPQAIPGDLSKCARWAALRERILSKNLGSA